MAHWTCSCRPTASRRSSVSWPPCSAAWAACERLSYQPEASARPVLADAGFAVVLTHLRSVMRQWVLLGIAVLALAAIPGCKRGSIVKDEKTFELTPTVPHIL